MSWYSIIDIHVLYTIIIFKYAYNIYINFISIKYKHL